MELTNTAISKLIEKTAGQHHVVRIGLTGGGCAGMEYIFKYNEPIDNNESDTVFDYGKFTIRIDEQSIPFLRNATLDYIVRGINESFEIINPDEESRCGCGVSVIFKP